MDQQNQYIFGSLRDHSEARKIQDELLKREVHVELSIDESGMTHLRTLDEQSFPVALDYFRVAIGVKKPIKIEKEWKEIKSIPLGNFTFSVIIVCVVIFGLGWLLKYQEVYNFLLFGPKEGGAFSLINQGEYWRLLTPAFIHFGFLHIIFNLMWWRDLGNILEYTKGRLFIAIFLIVTGVGSNVLQASFTGANFGGLSGVVYALLGYLWIYKKINNKAKFSLPKSDITLMVGWFFLCMIPGLFPFGVANYAHGGGLVSGMILGAVFGLKDKS